MPRWHREIALSATADRGLAHLANKDQRGADNRIERDAARPLGQHATARDTLASRRHGSPRKAHHRRPGFVRKVGAA